MIKKLFELLLLRKISYKKANLLSGYRAYTEISHPIKTHHKSFQNKYTESVSHIKNMGFLKLHK